MAATDPTNFTREQIEALGGVISGNVGKARVLTSADYNYPANNPTAVALWLLPPGVYMQPSTALNVYANNESIISSYTAGTFIVGNTKEGKVKILAYGAASDSPAMIYSTIVVDGSKNYVRHLIDETRIVDTLTSTSTELVLPVKTGKTLNDKIEGRLITNAGAPTTATVGTVGQLLEDTTNGKLYICTAIVPGTDPDPDTYTWEEVGAGGGGSGPTVVQTTGTSTTDVMSQNAVTSMVYADPSTQTKVKLGYNAQNNGVNTVVIGAGAQTGANRAIAIGASCYAVPLSSVAIGYGARSTTQGQFDIGENSGVSSGYNNSNYRLLTGLYDPQNAHDAATKGYVDPTTDSSAPTTATVGRLGQIQIDTTTATAYMCVAVDTVTPAYTWKQITA